MPIDILMPALSPTMTEGTLAKWLVKEGDEVASGDVIAEIETDKATMEVEAVEEGTVAKILVAEGSEGVSVNSVIAVLVEEGEAYDPSKPTPEKPTPTEPTAAAPAVEGDRAASVDAEPKTVTDSAPSVSVPQALGARADRLRASPLARRLAAQGGLDLSQLTGSGPGGRIIKRDVEAANAAPVAAVSTAAGMPQNLSLSSVEPSGPTPVEVQRPNGVRKIIAKRLSESKFTSPHFYVTMDMELDALLALRKQINANPETLKVSVNDLIIMACGRALKAVPAANAAWIGEEIHQYLRADVSVAVALDGGLVTPVVRGADTLSLSQISATANELIGKAREGKLLPEQMQGGSFSISNMGMMGVKQFTAIINPPQGAILAVGAGEQRAVVKDGALAIATVMTCTLSSDHRVIDGAVAAKLLGKIKNLIENPVQMLV